MKDNISYFLYTRKSSEGEDRQVASIPAQIEELKRIAQYNNLTIVDTLIEEKSAKNPGRPVFTDMLSRLHNGEANGIICWKLDRLARNPIDGGNISWMLQQGIIQHIQTFQRSYYPTDNVLMMNLEFGMANQYIIDLSVNIKRGQRQKLAEGWLPHKPPVGYLNNKYHEEGKPPIYRDPNSFHILKQCWQIFIEQRLPIEHLHQVATDMGLKNPKGKPFSKSKFHTLFKNPFYYGSFWWNDQLYEGKHEPMISKQDFDLAQDILDGRIRTCPKYHAFAYTGLMRCGECGAAITAEKKTKHQKNGNTHHYTYYRCTKNVKKGCTQKTIREEVLEEQIATILGEIEIPDAFHQWAIKHLKEEKQKEESDRDAIIQSHQDHLNLSNRKLDTLFSMRLNNEINAEEFAKQKQLIESEKSRLMELLQDAQHRANHWVSDADDFFEFAKTAKSKFETGTTNQKKAILHALGGSLVLLDRTLHVQLSEPLKLIKQVVPQAKTVMQRLEPVLSKNSSVNADVLDEELAKNEFWWR